MMILLSVEHKQDEYQGAEAHVFDGSPDGCSFN